MTVPVVAPKAMGVTMTCNNPREHIKLTVKAIIKLTMSTHEILPITHTDCSLIFLIRLFFQQSLLCHYEVDGTDVNSARVHEHVMNSSNVKYWYVCLCMCAYMW